MGKKAKKSVRQKERASEAAEAKRKHARKEKKKKRAAREKYEDASSIDSPTCLTTYLHSADPDATDFEAWKVDEWFNIKRRQSVGGGILDWWMENDILPPKRSNSITGELSGSISEQGIERLLMEMTVDHSKGQMSLKLISGLPALQPVPTLVSDSPLSSRTMSPEPSASHVDHVSPGPDPPGPQVVRLESPEPDNSETSRNDSVIHNTTDTKMTAGNTLPKTFPPQTADSESCKPTTSEVPIHVHLPPDRGHNNWDWRVVHGNASYCSDRTWFGEDFKELDDGYGCNVKGVGTVYLDLYRNAVCDTTVKVKLENVYYVPGAPCNGALETHLLKSVAATKYEQHPFCAQDESGEGLIWSLVDDIGRSRLMLPRMSFESLIIDSMRNHDGSQLWMLDIIINQEPTTNEKKSKTGEPQAKKKPQTPKPEKGKAIQDMRNLVKTLESMQEEAITEDVEKAEIKKVENRQNVDNIKKLISEKKEAALRRNFDVMRKIGDENKIAENQQNVDNIKKLMSQRKGAETQHSLDSDKKLTAQNGASFQKSKIGKDTMEMVVKRVKELEMVEKIQDLVKQQETALQSMENTIDNMQQAQMPGDIQQHVDNIKKILAEKNKNDTSKMNRKLVEEALLRPAEPITPKEVKDYEYETLQRELRCLELGYQQTIKGTAREKLILKLMDEVKMDLEELEDEMKLEEPLALGFLDDLEASRLLREAQILHTIEPTTDAEAKNKRERYDELSRRLAQFGLTEELEALDPNTIDLSTMTPDELKHLGIQKLEEELRTLERAKGMCEEHDRKLRVENSKKRLEDMRNSKEPFTMETVILIDVEWITREMELMGKLTWSTKEDVESAQHREDDMKERLVWLKESLAAIRKAKDSMTPEEVKRTDWAIQNLMNESEKLEQRKGDLRGAHMKTILKQIEEVKEKAEEVRNLKEPLTPYYEVQLELQRLSRQLELVSTAEWTAEAKKLKMDEINEKVDEVEKVKEVVRTDQLRELEVKKLEGELLLMEGLKGLKMTTKYVAQKRRDRLLILEAEKAQSQAFWDELCAKSEKQRGEESCQSNDSEGNGEELLQPEPTG